MQKKLLKNSIIYVMGDILNKSVPFFMLPVLTRYLTPEDYGIISVFAVFVAILTVFTGLSVHGAVNVNFFRMQKEELKEFIGNVFILLNMTTLVVLVFVLAGAPFLRMKIDIPLEWMVVAVFLAFSQFLTTINLGLWMAEQRPKPYSIYQFLQTLLTMSLSLILIIGLGMNWEGQLLAQALGITIFSGISFIFLIRRGYLIFRWNRNHISDALKFGIPLIPHALAGWVITGADRIILMALVGGTLTGLYSVGYQIGMVVSVVVAAFNKAWVPYLFGVLSDNPSFSAKKKIVKFTYMYMVAVFLFAIVFAFSANLILPFFLGEKFLSSQQYILYISLAFSFQGMYLMVTNYMFYLKKTYLLAYATFSAAVIHIFLAFLLVNVYGAIGAAYSSLITFALMFLFTWYLCSRVYKMPWFFWWR